MPAIKRWHAAQVIKATDIPVDIFRRWLDRRVIVLDGTDIDPGGSGRPRMFGARSVYRVAIVHRLTRAGLNPPAALSLANIFCDTSQTARPPGQLFPSGRTILVADPNGNGRILHLPPDQNVDDVLISDVSIVVDLGKIIRRVNSRLGLATDVDNSAAVLHEFRNSQLKATHETL
jgi:hypothetical protein